MRDLFREIKNLLGNGLIEVGSVFIGALNEIIPWAWGKVHKKPQVFWVRMTCHVVNTPFVLMIALGERLKK